MHKYILILLMLFQTSGLFSQKVEIIDAEGLTDLLVSDSDTIFLLNFWATWCKPCTEEMPVLLKFAEDNSESKFQMILISLDMPSMIDTRLADFIRNNGIKSRVLLLDEPDADKWIPLVDESWTGSIPATLIFTPGGEERFFHEGKISYKELSKAIRAIMN